MRKGEVDLVSSGRDVYALLFEGSPRRCGGQGDILAGVTGVNIHWAMQRAHLYTPSVLDTSTCEAERSMVSGAEDVNRNDQKEEDLLKTLLASDSRALPLPQLPNLSHLFPSSSSSSPAEHTQGTHEYCILVYISSVCSITPKFLYCVISYTYRYIRKRCYCKLSRDPQG